MQGAIQALIVGYCYYTVIENVEEVAYYQQTAETTECASLKFWLLIPNPCEFACMICECSIIAHIKEQI